MVRDRIPAYDPAPSMRKPRRRLLFAAVAAGVGLALALGVAEVWLRSREGAAPMRWGWRDPYVLAGQRPASEVNEFGYRGRAITYTDADYVVVLVGDSQVQADACAFAEMPERRLQQHLQRRLQRPVVVFTMGALGYGTDQQSLALDEYLARHRADLVIAWITPGNDLRENLLPIAPVPKPTFWLDAAGALCGPTATIGAPVPQGLRIWQRLKDALRGPLEVYWERHVLPPPGEHPLHPEAELTRDWTPLLLVGENLGREITNVLVQLDSPSPRARYAVDLMRALLRRMQAAAAARGARFAGLLDDRTDFPLRDGVYAAEIDGVPHHLKLSRAAYEANIRRITQDLGFVRVTVTTDPFVAGPGDPHLNAKAVDEVMAGLAAGLPF